MIIPSPKGKDVQRGKQEGDGNSICSNNNFFKGPSSSSSNSTRQWQSLSRNNPRIVRVSHAIRGKDRHSKVSTVRGLRDRRIRLSVPTAIQLYDLQDRLGLGQPSKVIDWLLDASKQDISTLPPLQVPVGSSFGQFHEQHMPFDDDHDDHQPCVPPQPSLNIAPSMDSDGKTHYSLLHSKEATTVKSSNIDGYEDQTALIMPKSKQPVNHDAVDWSTRRKEIEGAERTQNREGGLGYYSLGNSPAQAHYAQNFVPMTINSSHASVASFSNNAALPYASFFHWPEPPSLCSSSQFGTHGTFPFQTHQYINNSTALLLQSSSSASPVATLFPSYAAPYISTSDPRTQITSSHLPLLRNNICSSRNMAPTTGSREPLPPHDHHQRAISSSLVKSFPFMNVNSKLVHLQSMKDEGSQETKDDTTS